MQERRSVGIWRIGAAALAMLLSRSVAKRAPQHATRTGQTSQPRASGEAGSAAAAGQGRDATRPEEIPAQGWWQILKRTLKQAGEDRLLTEAAGVTFYSLLALFPAIAALVSVYGIFADRGTISEHLSALSGVVPGGGMDLITDQVNRLTAQPATTLGFSAVAGIAVSLWSANQATKAIFDALNVVYDEKEKRSFIRLTLTTLLFTGGGVFFVTLAMTAIVVIPVVLDSIGLSQVFEWFLRIARWPLMLAAIGLVLACLYRWGPSRAVAKWRWVSWGSAVAAVLWLIVSFGFSWYVANFGSYNETYGSLGAVIGFMTWIWISSAIVLLGAELNAEMEHQTSRDTTTGAEEPMGTRQARMADEVATE
jgi:membrane protein